MRLRARLRDRLRFGVPGAVLLAGAWQLDALRIVPQPIAILVGLGGVMVLGFALLPPVGTRKAPPARSPRSKRPPPKARRTEEALGPPPE